VIEIEEIKEKGTFSTSPQKTGKYTFTLKDVDPKGVLKKAGGSGGFQYRNRQHRAAEGQGPH